MRIARPHAAEKSGTKKLKNRLDNPDSVCYYI